MDWESTNYTPRRLLSSSNSGSQPINPMTAGQQYQCNGLTVICQKSESSKSNTLQIQSPGGNIQGSAEVMTQLNTQNTELRENRKRRLSDDSQSEDESGSEEQPITGNTLEDKRRELEEKRAELNTLDIERHSKCQELLDQHYRELDSRATHFAVHPVPTAENVQHTARKLERELIDARDQSIRYFEEHPRLDVCRMATESFTESNQQCKTMLEQCRDTTKRYHEYIDAIPYGTVYYQVADYDDKQMKAVNKLYHDKDAKKKGILLFDENDVDKKRGPKEATKYRAAQSSPIAQYELTHCPTDHTFTFGITTVFVTPSADPRVACPMETCYKRLIDGQFKDLWDRFLSKGYDVVVPSIGFGLGKTHLPEEYLKYIQAKLTSLEEKTGREKKVLEKDEQYGVDPPQPVAVGVTNAPISPPPSPLPRPDSVSPPAPVPVDNEPWCKFGDQPITADQLDDAILQMGTPANRFAKLQGLMFTTITIPTSTIIMDFGGFENSGTIKFGGEAVAHEVVRFDSRNRNIGEGNVFVIEYKTADGYHWQITIPKGLYIDKISYQITGKKSCDENPKLQIPIIDPQIEALPGSAQPIPPLPGIVDPPHSSHRFPPPPISTIRVALPVPVSPAAAPNQPLVVDQKPWCQITKGFVKAGQIRDVLKRTPSEGPYLAALHFTTESDQVVSLFFDAQSHPLRLLDSNKAYNRVSNHHNAGRYTRVLYFETGSNDDGFVFKIRTTLDGVQPEWEFPRESKLTNVWWKMNNQCDEGQKSLAPGIVFPYV